MDSIMNFHIGRMMEARQLVVEFHYSRRPPANIQLVGTWHEDGGLYGDLGPAVAACFLSIPPTRWREEVWELSRLVRNNIKVELTGLVSATCKAAKRSGGHLLVSFADRTHGHHGGIYQASSWNYHGLRNPSNDGVVVGGVFVPGRTANSRWGTRSADKLSKLLGQRVEKHYDEGKHLYWKSLTSLGKHRASRLGLLALPYPKPGTFNKHG